jgi:hypothetical protein
MSQAEKIRALTVGRRWNSYLMLKPYYQLIYSGVPASALGAMFALDRPLLQFRPHAIYASDQEAFRILRQLGEEGAVRLLGRSVFIHLDDKEAVNETEVTLDPETVGRSVDESFEREVLAYTHNELEIRVKGESSGYLLWSEGFDLYWKAYLDGEEVPVLRANIAFKAVKLPSGIHRVRFEYDPVWYRRSVAVFLLMQAALLIFTAGLFLERGFNALARMRRVSAEAV